MLRNSDIIVIPESQWDSFGDYSIEPDKVFSFPVHIPLEGITVEFYHTGKNNQDFSVSLRLTNKPYGAPILRNIASYNTFSINRVRRSIHITRTHIDDYPYTLGDNHIVYFAFMNLENKKNYFNFYVPEEQPDCTCK